MSHTSEINTRGGKRINPALQVSSCTDTGEGLFAALDGQLRYDATEPLQAFFSAQLKQARNGNLTLNCRNISFVDSQGLALLLLLHRLCAALGGALTVLEPPPRLRDLLKLTRFDTVVKVA